MLAVHLARIGARVALIDREERVAGGLAYATAEPVHLLNVRAGNMSAYPDAPAHFADWLRARGEGDAATFATRLAYRDYLAQILRSAPEGVKRYHDGVVAVEETRLRLASGGRVEADVVVIAAGNLPPEPVAGFAGGLAAFVNDPWSPEGRATLRRLAEQGGDVLIIGTGLTMVDTVLTLEAHGYGGTMTALSRRGLLPQPHAAAAPAKAAPPTDRSPRGLARWLRRQAAGADWRLAVDSLRPVTQAIWREWSIGQRAQFLRHARPWWDVHRHRIAPEIADRIDRLRASGRLRVRAGRIAGFEGDRVLLRPRGQATVEAGVFAGIVNCTGPQGDLRRTGNPLLRDLLDRGEARVDGLGLGLDVDDRSRLLGPDGDALPGRYAIGPMTRGAFWEIVAVPDIRAQAQALAATIVADHRR